MNISEVTNKITDIETRSEEAHRRSFDEVNGRWIIIDEADAYRDLLEKQEAIRQYEEYVAQNQAVIDQYEKLKKGAYKVTEPVVGAPVVAEEPKKKTRKVTNRRPAGKKKAAPKKAAEEKGEQPQPIEPTAITNVPVVEPVKNEEPKMVEVPLLGPAVEPSLDPNSYRLKRGEIIQDLPIHDKRDQVFTTPGMNADAIKASQDKLSQIKEVDMTTYKDPIEIEIARRAAEWEAEQAKKKAESAPYKPMTPEEIEASRKKLGFDTPAKKMTPEEIEASKKKIAESDPKKEPKKEPEKTTTPEETKGKKKGKKQIVTKRRKFDWKNNSITQGFGKAYTAIKGLIFAENMAGRTKDYMNACILIGRCRAAYKTRTPEVNIRELKAIDHNISTSVDLTFEEKTRLYKKLTKLSRQVERYNRKTQNKAFKESAKIIDGLNDDVSLGRR